MVILVQAVTGRLARGIAWVSLQGDGGISVGLSDRTFISPRFHARQFIWSLYNRVTVQYLVPQDRSGLVAVRNPHLTFHPPVYFHLRANNDEELFAGIADVGLMLDQDGRVPWIRFVSRPVRDMTSAAAPRDLSGSGILTVEPPSADCSIGLGVDFVRDGDSARHDRLLDHYADCAGRRIHIFCETLPGQRATLSWYHQY
jgi:hypothetical protein